MDSHFEKYLDIRFDHIEEDIKAIHSDIKDNTKIIDKLKYWILGTFLGTFIGIATLFFTVIGYYTWTLQNQFNHHQASIQAQMQSFSDYVKAVTKTQVPKPPMSPQ